MRKLLKVLGGCAAILMAAAAGATIEYMALTDNEHDGCHGCHLGHHDEPSDEDYEYDPDEEGYDDDYYAPDEQYEKEFGDGLDKKNQISDIDVKDLNSEYNIELLGEKIKDTSAKILKLEEELSNPNIEDVQRTMTIDEYIKLSNIRENLNREMISRKQG